MKFNLEETVTGADLRPDGAILTFPRNFLPEALDLLSQMRGEVDAFTVDENRVTAAVFFPSKASLSPLLQQGVSVERGFFRLTLRGSRLSEGKGLWALWESLLAKEKIPLRLSCSDACGITQYLPDAARPRILELLHQTFGICAV